MTEIGEILSTNQLTELYNQDITDKKAVRGVTDEQLLSIEGIGPAAVGKLREWAKRSAIAEGDAISFGYMVIRKGEETLNVAPGDVIPAKYDAKTRVEQGKARWRNPSDL